MNNLVDNYDNVVQPCMISMLLHASWNRHVNNSEHMVCSIQYKFSLFQHASAMNNFVISIAYTRKISQAVTWRVGVVAWTIFNTWTTLLSCAYINIVGPTIIRAGLTKGHLGHVPHPAPHKNDHVLKTMNQNSVEIRMQYITPCIQSLDIKYTISHKIQWLKV